MPASPVRCTRSRRSDCVSSTSTGPGKICNRHIPASSRSAQRLAQGQPIEIFGDGEQVRDFTFVGDAVAALRRALTVASTNAPVFNVCTGKGTSVRALAKILAALYQTDIAAYYSPARSGEVRMSIGDPRRAAEQLGFRAETTLAAGLPITLDLPCAPVELEPLIVA